MIPCASAHSPDSACCCRVRAAPVAARLDDWEAEQINFPNDVHDDHTARLLAQWAAGEPEETVVYEDRVSISPV
jgi:hypothetical protein